MQSPNKYKEERGGYMNSRFRNFFAEKNSLSPGFFILRKDLQKETRGKNFSFRFLYGTGGGSFSFREFPFLTGFPEEASLAKGESCIL